MDPVRHLRFSLAALVAIIAIGTFGYSMVEDWSLFDSLYMTVITLSRQSASKRFSPYQIKVNYSPSF